MSGPGGDQHKDGRTVPNTTDVQDLTMNDDVAENAAITTENLDSAIQGNTPAPTQSASSSSAPVSVPVPQNTTVTTPAQQNALPHLPGPFTPEQMEQIRAFLAATAYLSDSTSLTSSSTSSMGSAPSVPVPTETGVAKPSTAPTPVRTPLTNQNSAERRNADNSQMDTDNSPTPRRTRDQNDVDEEELSDIPPAPVFQTENERKWVLVRNNQVLPTVPYTGRAPEPTNTPAYTAWILNNLCHSFPNEPLLWTLLGRNGGVSWFVLSVTGMTLTQLYRLRTLSVFSGLRSVQPAQTPLRLASSILAARRLVPRLRHTRNSRVRTSAVRSVLLARITRVKARSARALRRRRSVVVAQTASTTLRRLCARSGVWL
jgi:hypothetical protein